MSWQKDILDVNSPQSEYAVALAASFKVPGLVRVYGFTVSNTKSSAQFAQMFDASDVPADAVVPILAKSLGASDAVAIYFGPMGRVFKRGIVLCNSSTQATKTIGSADCLFDVQYELLHQ